MENAEKDKRNAFQERDELASCLEEAEQMAENTEQALAKMTNEMHDVKVGLPLTLWRLNLILT